MAARVKLAWSLNSVGEAGWIARYPPGIGGLAVFERRYFVVAQKAVRFSTKLVTRLTLGTP